MGRLKWSCRRMGRMEHELCWGVEGGERFHAFLAFSCEKRKKGNISVVGICVETWSAAIH
jgi:hypothetical protein